ncbi:MAG TPA: phosphoribosylanthranilate isomerase [Acidobacteriaceae bacterium]
MWVKICGTTTLEDAQLAADAGADAIGFVFAESKRRVTPDQVAPITAALANGIEKVGVFHSDIADGIIAGAREAGLSAIQIHSAYNADTVRLLRRELGPEYKLLQVITCPVETLNEDKLRAELSQALADRELWGILLDASRGGISGGTGQSFNWSDVAKILDEVWPDRGSGSGMKLILAGGLRPENVREAIAALRPDGVDVVSGVERMPGVKDPDRVREFVARARM